MDRYLIAGAVLLLTLEITYLITDLGSGNAKLARTGLAAASSTQIGEMKRTENQVRRRNQSSLVWDESQSKDTLFEFDSILTLKDSTAQIHLQGGTVLNLDENTLVVLEPSPQGKSGSLRIRFSKGTLRSKNPGQRLALAAETWTLDATQGSELSLVGLDSGEFEVTLQSGHAELQTSTGVHEVTDGERVHLNTDGDVEKTKVSKTLRWSKDIPRRIYARSFPLDLNLQWEGDGVEKLIIARPGQALERRLPTPFVAVEQGTYHFSLSRGEEESEALTVQVRLAPSIRYFSPLPRDRYNIGEEILFSWEPLSQASRYRLETSTDQEFTNPQPLTEGDQSRARARLTQEGRQFWRITPLDSDGWPIPASRVYPIFSVPKPLDAPDLNSPMIRAPADEHSSQPRQPNDGATSRRLEEDTSRRLDGAWLRHEHRFAPQSAAGLALFSWLLPTAFAASETAGTEAGFSWKQVPGADHYVIEISATPGFEEPLVTARVSEPLYVWRRFKPGVYFWRVAGGRAANPAAGLEEQMGRFSPPAMVTLSTNTTAGREPVVQAIPVPPTGESARVLPPALSPSPDSARPPHQAKTAGTPAPANVADHSTPPPTPPMVSEPKQSEPVEQKSIAQDAGSPIPLRISLFYDPHYVARTSHNAEKIEGSFSGPVPQAFAGEITGFFRGHVTLLGSYEETEWKPKNEAQAPFQKSMRENRWSARALYGSARGRWSFGLGAETLSLFARIASESGKLKTLIIYGPSLRWQHSGAYGNVDLQLDARSGRDLSGGRLTAGWQFPISDTRICDFSIGPFAAAGIFSGSESRRLTEYTGGIRLGMHF